MSSKIRYSSLIAIVAISSYLAVVFAGLAYHQRQVLSLIHSARGSVEYRAISLNHWLPGDRVRAISLPESAIGDNPNLLRQFRCFRKLDRVTVAVMSAQCPDKVRAIDAANGSASLARYYRFVHSGRPCSLTRPVTN